MSLKFNAAALSQEIELVKKASSKYLQNPYVFDHLAFGWKKGFSGPPGSEFVWEIPRDMALKTKLSCGDYAQDGMGGLSVFATLSFIWKMRVVSAGAKAIVEPFDLASTEVKIFNQIPDEQPVAIAEWQFDIADANSPGCHFHMQVDWKRGQGQESMDVPRIPVPMVLPTDALEFVLGELFQTEWPKHRTAHGVNSFQRTRMSRMLKWMHDQLEDSGTAPWLALKSLKPLPADKLFIHA
jgi:hypothetical protein